MTTSYDSSSLYSAFLSLPTEIRCEIYDYLLVDSQSITISAGYITVFGNRIADRARKHDIPGLPFNLAPLVRQSRDASLLSVAKPPEIPIDECLMAEAAQKDSTVGMPAPLALLLTCRLVNDELTDYMRGRKQIKTARARSANPTAEEDEPVMKDDNEGLSLYVTYPYGVLVLKSMYPYLLKQARRVYISGHYSSPGDSEPGSPTSSEEGEDRTASRSPNHSARCQQDAHYDQDARWYTINYVARQTATLHDRDYGSILPPNDRSDASPKQNSHSLLILPRPAPSHRSPSHTSFERFSHPHHHNASSFLLGFCTQARTPTAQSGPTRRVRSHIFSRTYAEARLTCE
jgi:hypothetical protein